MGLEFRNGDEKVLGTQPHPIRESASSHYVLRLNLINGSFNIVIYTHIHASIHLSCTSYHLIQGNKQQDITRAETLIWQHQRNMWLHSRHQETHDPPKHVQLIIKYIYIHFMFIWMHDLPYSISALMHQWIDIWMHVHGIKARKEKKNLI